MSQVQNVGPMTTQADRNCRGVRGGGSQEFPAADVGSCDPCLSQLPASGFDVLPIAKLGRDASITDALGFTSALRVLLKRKARFDVPVNLRIMFHPGAGLGLLKLREAQERREGSHALPIFKGKVMWQPGLIRTVVGT